MFEEVRGFMERSKYTALDRSETSGEKYNSDTEECSICAKPAITSAGWRAWALYGFLGIGWIIAIAMFPIAASHRTQVDPNSIGPLSSVLQYEQKRFTTGLDGDTTTYQGAPSAENTAAWDHITNTGIVTLSQSEQDRLAEDSAIFNSTGNELMYLGAVEVFHQLHCLDMLRQEVYGALDDFLAKHPSKKDKMQHLDHCVDFLRQSLMCRPNIEILPFEVVKGNFKARFDGIHTCANFENIRNWAVKRQAGDLTPQ